MPITMSRSDLVVVTPLPPQDVERLWAALIRETLRGLLEPLVDLDASEGQGLQDT